MLCIAICRQQGIKTYSNVSSIQIQESSWPNVNNPFDAVFSSEANWSRIFSTAELFYCIGEVLLQNQAHVTFFQAYNMFIHKICCTCPLLHAVSEWGMSFSNCCCHWFISCVFVLLTRLLRYSLDQIIHFGRPKWFTSSFSHFVSN